MKIQCKFPQIVFAAITSLAIVSSVVSCVSDPSVNTGVQRVATDEVYDLTGKWNDIDSQQVANKMVDSVLGADWLRRWTASQRPVLIVGDVRNNTSEHIDLRLLVKDLESELVNSGEVTFVANASERVQVRNERDDQQSNSAEESMKRIAQETGADYVLIGGIGSSVEETPSTKVVSYLVTMELINVESNVKAWVGAETIKKVINKTKQSRRNTRERISSDW